MKKHNLLKLAVMGCGMCLMFGGQAMAQPQPTMTPCQKAAEQDYQNVMTEEEFTSQLSEQNKTIYMNMSPEAQDMARKLASQKCGPNDMNCKGGYMDPNEAVKQASKQSNPQTNPTMNPQTNPKEKSTSQTQKYKPTQNTSSANNTRKTPAQQ